MEYSVIVKDNSNTLSKEDAVFQPIRDFPAGKHKILIQVNWL
jgi:hypothetical protein